MWGFFVEGGSPMSSRIIFFPVADEPMCFGGANLVKAAANMISSFSDRLDSDSAADFLFGVSKCLSDGFAFDGSYGSEDSFWMLALDDANEQAAFTYYCDEDGYETWTCHGVGRFDDINEIVNRQFFTGNTNVRRKFIADMSSDELTAVCEYIREIDQHKPTPPPAPANPLPTRSVVV